MKNLAKSNEYFLIKKANGYVYDRRKMTKQEKESFDSAVECAEMASSFGSTWKNEPEVISQYITYDEEDKEFYFVM